MRIALITLAFMLAAAVYGFFGQALAGSLHEADACPAQSWDQKTGPNEFWWKAVTACNDHAAEELNHFVQLQVFNWDTGQWQFTSFGQFGANSFWDDFMAHTRFWQVDDYLGTLCYRVRTHHFVVEWGKGASADALSYSAGQCY